MACAGVVSRASRIAWPMNSAPSTAADSEVDARPTLSVTSGSVNVVATTTTEYTRICVTAAGMPLATGSIGMPAAL